MYRNARKQYIICISGLLCPIVIKITSNCINNYLLLLISTKENVLCHVELSSSKEYVLRKRFNLCSSVADR